MQLLNEMSGQLEDSSLLVHHLMDKWPETVQAILKHDKLEKRKTGSQYTAINVSVITRRKQV